MNFPFETNGKLMILGIPILKHFRVNKQNSVCTRKKTNAELQIRGGMRIILRYFFLFLNENISCDPSLELSQQDGSNEGS